MYMKKAFLALAVLCGIGLMTGCKNGTAGENQNDTLQPANEVVSNESTTKTIWDELERLTDKIYASDTLLPEEWSFFFEHFDTLWGSPAEATGHALYGVLTELWYSEHMEREGLAHLSPEKREHVLESMMYLMDIDIMEDAHTYTWDEFTTQFPVFEGSKAAEKALEEINKWKEEINYWKKEESNQ